MCGGGADQREARERERERETAPIFLATSPLSRSYAGHRASAQVGKPFAEPPAPSKAEAEDEIASQSARRPPHNWRVPSRCRRRHLCDALLTLPHAEQREDAQALDATATDAEPADLRPSAMPSCLKSWISCWAMPGKRARDRPSRLHRKEAKRHSPNAKTTPSVHARTKLSSPLSAGQQPARCPWRA